MNVYDIIRTVRTEGKSESKRCSINTYIKKRLLCLSGPFFAASSHHFFSRRSMRTQILTITTKLNACACIYTHIYRGSFSFFWLLSFCVHAVTRKGRKRRTEKKEQENKQTTTHLNNDRAVFFSFSSSDFCLA
jgi:hypothetical protein